MSAPSVPSPKEIILMAGIKKQSLKAACENKRADSNEAWFIRALLTSPVRDEMLREYVLTGPTIWLNISSEVVGVRSIIDTYTNKKGETFKAHFTIHKKYLGPVSKMGEEPTFYNGNFAVKDYLDRFQFVWNPDATEFSHIILPRLPAAPEPTPIPEIPVPEIPEVSGPVEELIEEQEPPSDAEATEGSEGSQDSEDEEGGVPEAPQTPPPSDRKSWAIEQTKRVLAENNLSDWRVKVSDRMTSSGGACTYNTKTIKLSGPMLRSNKVSQQNILHVIYHEVAHAIAGYDAKHNNVWRETCVRLGGLPRSTHTMKF